MNALHFPPAIKPAELSVIEKRPAKGSVPKITKGGGRVWGWVVAPLVIWTTIVIAGWLVWASFWGAR